MSKGKPEIYGPGKHKIQVSEPVPDATGHSNSEPEVPMVEAFEETQEIVDAIADSFIPLEFEPEPDPSFPFGTPDQIDYTKLDKAGVELIQELNKRPWVKTVEYCSGHPLDRPADELSELYPYVSGENVYQEINKLDMAMTRGLISDRYFRYRKNDLQTVGATRFFLNVNVMDIKIFQSFVKVCSQLLTVTTQSVVNPIIVRMNPLRPGNNFSIHWDYWTMAERNMIHAILLDALYNIPV